MAQALGSLSSNVRKVTLQFSMSHGNQVPRWVTWIEPETFADRESRKTAFAPGEQFLVPEEDASGRGVNNVSLVGILDDLEGVGYVLTEAVAQERLANKPGVPPYAMVRYTFYRHDLALRTKDFLRNEANIMRDLQEFLELATWRARGFRNPYFKNDGTVLEGSFGISINMEARNPLFVGNDKARPQVRWQKDANGERIGNAPVQVVPGCFVGILDNEVAFLVNEPVAEVISDDEAIREWTARRDMAASVNEQRAAGLRVGAVSAGEITAILRGGAQPTAMGLAFQSVLDASPLEEAHVAGEVADYVSGETERDGGLTQPMPRNAFGRIERIIDLDH